MNKIVEIRMTDHEIALKNDLKYLLNNENYWNVMMFCKDGTMALNRLTAGLIFPQLQDEISVICPDFTMQDITDQINQFLFFGQSDETKRDKICASHILDSDVQHFVQDINFSTNNYADKTNNDLPNQEVNLDVSFDMDLSLDSTNKELSPLDQLCLDLAPFNQKSKEKNSSLTPGDPGMVSSTPVKESKDNRNCEDVWTSAQSLDLDSSFDLAMKTLHDEVAKLSKTCSSDDISDLLDDSSENIVFGILESVLNNIDYEDDLETQDMNFSGLPNRTVSIDSASSIYSGPPQPSNLIFSTLGSFRQVEEDTEEPIVRLSVFESDQGFESSYYSPSSPLFDNDDHSTDVHIDNSFEYIEEKPDISRIHIPVDPERKTKYSCHVSIQKMKLSAEDWEAIHYYLEQADENDIMAKNKNEIKRETHIKLLRNVAEFSKGEKEHIRERRFVGKRPKRLNRCTKCAACIKPDCRKCIFCKDMKKYGGKGTKKQSCIERPKCLRTQHFEYKSKRGNTTTTTEEKKRDDPNPISRESFDNSDLQRSDRRSSRRRAKDQDSESDEIAEKRKKVNKEIDSESEELAEKRRKVKELKERFKKQEAALKEGKNPLLGALSRDEMLFGFYL